VHEEPLIVAAPPESFLERLDARAKLLCLLVWAVCTVTIPPGRFLLSSIYGFLLLALLLANPGLVGRFARRFAAALPFVILLTVLLPFLKAGRILWAWGPIEVTAEGLWTAQRVAAAALLCVSMVALTWASTSEPHLLAGLHGLAVPETLVDVLAFMLRYLEVLRPELHRLTDARAARVIGSHGPGTLRSGANVVGALFVRAHDRAARVGDAMTARGFTGSRRTLHRPHWHWHDVAIGGLFTAVVVLLRLTVHG
jgi:cobalt/nickel transport system permease protein